MWLSRLQLRDFRNYAELDLTFADNALTVLYGPNGAGKTNIAEAIAWFCLCRSFRGAPTDAIGRGNGSDVVGTIAAEVFGRPGQSHATSLEVTLPRSGRARLSVNGKGQRRGRVDPELLRVTLFSPVDLELLKEGPSGRRDYLDDTAVLMRPLVADVLNNYTSALKQRNAFLAQCQGFLGRDGVEQLELWDQQLVQYGEELIKARLQILDEITPLVQQSYRDIAGADVPVVLEYQSTLGDASFSSALVAARNACVRRGLTTVGPHRDELAVVLNGTLARTHASQGQQRSLALALRLSVHRLATERFGTPPVLVLDDVFSELDPARRQALIDHLPPGQTILTTASDLPDGLAPQAIYDIHDATVVPRAV